MEEARRNDEVISLASSQILRWIDELNSITDADEQARNIKAEIKRLRKEDGGVKTRNRIRALYSDLDRLQFKPDYVCLIIDKERDYWRACDGFHINGIRYVRLLGTNGGIKNSTIVFVSDRVADELRRRIENGREPGMPLVTAKLEAYKALTCSASNPVSWPDGILVVHDAETEFYDDIIYMTDEGADEPIMEERKHEKVTLDATDGFGLMLPSLAERWSEELGLDYVSSGFNCRMAFLKGMAFTFDFIDFAEKVAGGYKVKDAWGDEHDIRDIELVLTTSMVKLWDSYRTCDEYIRKSKANHYTFGIAKTCPDKLENERNLNYQFIQPLPLTDDDIDELIKPTADDIAGVLGDDWRKAALFLRGVNMTESNIERLEDDYIKALMINHDILNDPFVQNNIHKLIKNRIDEAKVGVLKVHGNFSILSGDPYLLCQSIFGMEKTGLLKAGEIYNRYWADDGAEKLACYRAPMTCINNIRLVRPISNEQVDYWYRYMTACTIFNSWDSAMAALNGADFDGDLCMLTDNDVIVRNLKPLPALSCAQRKAEKRLSTEEDFVRSNIASFGNEIGQTTNWITSMFEVQSHFDQGSKEYKELAYRICCGQLYQQNAIDKAKGIIAKPMPPEWHDRSAAGKVKDENRRELYRRIAAFRKPYFMRYIYPALKKSYREYIDNTNRNCLREFEVDVDTLRSRPDEELTDRQREFLYYYDLRMPVGTGDCVMNRICRKFEERFDGGAVAKADNLPKFDYAVMKSDADYTPRQYAAVKALYDDYKKRLNSYAVLTSIEKTDRYEEAAALSDMNTEFKRECDLVCPNEDVLCNIILDLCYGRNTTKRFAWSMCGRQIIRNLLAKSGGVISFPTLDEDGDFAYEGNTFREDSKKVDLDDSSE